MTFSTCSVILFLDSFDLEVLQDQKREGAVLYNLTLNLIFRNDSVACAYFIMEPRVQR